MPTTLTIHDETTSGAKTEALTLDLLTEHITVRELIRSRVFQEVKDHNVKQSRLFRGLVQPAEAEATRNGYELPPGRQIDWQRQYEAAIEAFERNGFFVLVDDKQVEDLETEIQVRPETQVSFVKLVPLVGG